MDNFILILGDSPFLCTIQDKLQYLLNRYYSIGINNVITKYYTNEHIFLDMPFVSLTNKFKGNTVTLKTYEGMIRKSNKYLIDTFTFDFNKDTSESICKDGKIAWCGFTHDYAVSYCVKRGVKHVVLVGAGDFSSGSHFSNSHNFRCSNVCLEQSKRFIEDYVTKVLDIRTVNPESFLQIPRISIEELLS